LSACAGVWNELTPMSRSAACNGVPGQAQDGIDFYSIRRSATKYRVLQCKREKKFTPKKIIDAVDEFLKGSWATRSEAFVLCTQESLRPTDRAEEVLRQRLRLGQFNVDFPVWDSEELNGLLKDHPKIVDDFFGREWTREVCVESAVVALERRVDGIQLAELRKKLAAFYRTVFDAHDPGLPVEFGEGGALPLQERYVTPDVLQEQSQSVKDGRSPPGGPAPAETPSDGSSPPGKEGNSPIETATQAYWQRRPLDDWLANEPHHCLTGSPGLGKSSLLRFLALDLLGDSPRFAAIAAAHGAFLPIWVSFPYWTKLLEESPTKSSLEDVMQAGCTNGVRTDFGLWFVRHSTTNVCCCWWTGWTNTVTKMPLSTLWRFFRSLFSGTLAVSLRLVGRWALNAFQFNKSDGGSDIWRSSLRSSNVRLLQFGFSTGSLAYSRPARLLRAK